MYVYVYIKFTVSKKVKILATLLFAVWYFLRDVFLKFCANEYQFRMRNNRIWYNIRLLKYLSYLNKYFNIFQNVSVGCHKRIASFNLWHVYFPGQVVPVLVHTHFTEGARRVIKCQQFPCTSTILCVLKTFSKLTPSSITSAANINSQHCFTKVEEDQ